MSLETQHQSVTSHHSVVSIKQCSHRMQINGHACPSNHVRNYATKVDAVDASYLNVGGSCCFLM